MTRANPATWEDRAQALRELNRRRSAGRKVPSSVAAKVSDPLIYLQRHTKTKDPHWRESGAKSPHRPFPDKPYFPAVVQSFREEEILFIEKSRDLMMSWLIVALFTIEAMVTPGIEVLFQSQKEDKAFELVDYSKELYRNQDRDISDAFPLEKPFMRQPEGAFYFANGSRIIGIPEGADQIRSYHPWGLLQDEAAFQPQAGEAYDDAVSVCMKIVALSSAGPGWFADFVQDITRIDLIS